MFCRLAFDWRGHDGLLYKLLKYNIGGKLYDLIKSLYMKSKSSIEFDYQRSALIIEMVRVRQGCLLSPMLFNFYVTERRWRSNAAEGRRPKSSGTTTWILWLQGMGLNECYKSKRKPNYNKTNDKKKVKANHKWIKANTQGHPPRI